MSPLLFDWHIICRKQSFLDWLYTIFALCSVVYYTYRWHKNCEDLSSQSQAINKTKLNKLMHPVVYVKTILDNKQGCCWAGGVNFVLVSMIFSGLMDMLGFIV